MKSLSILTKNVVGFKKTNSRKIINKNTFKCLQKEFEAWTIAQNKDKGDSITHRKSKLDYIFSNLPLEYSQNSKYNERLGDHTTLSATYRLK